MIKVEVVTGLLASLHRHVVHLRAQQKYTLKELTDDFVRWNGVLHLLQLSAQHVTDIGAHLLAGSGLGVPEDYKQIILQMGQNHILPSEFAGKIAPMASFRNILVHHYITIAPDAVAKILYDDLSDFDDFEMHIYDYLRREGYLTEDE